MISRELEAEILRLYHAEHWRVGTIATQLGVHHSSVRRVLTQAGIPAARQSVRSSIVDPYIPFMVETLDKYPRLTASRLYEMVKSRGYPGAPDHFRSVVARHRPRPQAEAFLRLRTLPGEQAQIDWAHFGKIAIGRALRPLMAFVMILSFSRRVFLRFYLNAAMGNFIRGHVDAFAYFNGVARELLYDNLKSAVLERRGDAIRFHPTLLELAAYYHFAPHPVAPYRGNEKGRVERIIRFIRERFFAARKFLGVDDLNAQALDWCDTTAIDRPCPEDRVRTVREVFEQEQPRLLTLPDNPFPTDESVTVKVRKTPYARFDLNDYSLPHTHVQRDLTVLASLDTVRILDGEEVIASHPRSFDRDQQIENPAHIDTLAERKRAARKYRAMDRLHHAAPSSKALFAACAERGVNLGALTRGLVRLLDAHGPAALETAIAEALAHHLPHLGTVRQLLDRDCHARGQPPPLPVPLPDDPRLRDLHVQAHPLSDYEQLQPRDDRHDDDTDQ